MSDHNEVTQKGDVNAARLRAVQRLSCVPLSLCYRSFVSFALAVARDHATAALASARDHAAAFILSLPLPVVRNAASAKDYIGYKFEIEIPWSIWGGEWSDSTHTMFGTRYRCLKKVNCLRSVLGEGL